MRFSSIALLFGLLISFAGGQVLPPIALNPHNVNVDSGEFRLTVSGFNFVATSQVLWNGQARATQFVDSRTVKATITSDDVSKPDLVQISVVDSSTGAAISDSAVMFVSVPLPAYDLIYDTQRARVYISVSQQHPNGPSLAIMEPQHGFVERYIPLPTEPGVLALSDDSRYLYVALSDRIRRMDLTGALAYVDILLSPSSLPVTSMFPLPGQGTSLVMAGPQPIADPNNRVFLVGAPCVAGSQDGSTIYDSTVYGSSGGTITFFKTDGAGLVFQSSTNGLLGGPSCPILASGLLYDSGGNVVDPSVPSVVGRFGAWGLVRPVPELQRTYFVGTDDNPAGAFNPLIYFKSFDNTTQQQLQSIPIPVTLNSFSGRLIHWGSDGLGFAEYPGPYPGRVGPSTRILLFHSPAEHQ